MLCTLGLRQRHYLFLDGLCFMWLWKMIILFQELTSHIWVIGNKTYSIQVNSFLLAQGETWLYISVPNSLHIFMQTTYVYVVKWQFLSTFTKYKFHVQQSQAQIEIHLTFTWCSPDVHLTTWPSSDLPLTLTRPLPYLD